MNPSAQALTDYMSELSEQAYSAVWMQGLEFELWRAVVEGPRRFGHLDITTEHISKLRTLSDACGSWIVHDEESGEKPMDLDEWRKIYADRITSQPLMTPQPFTTTRFIVWAVLVTLGFAFLLATQGRPIVPFLLPLQIATFVVMPQAIRNARHKRPLTLIQGLLVLGAVAVAAALIWWLVHRPTTSDEWGRSLLDSFSHPMVAVPLWIGFLYLGYRRWRMKPPLQEGLGQETTQP
jgi:hypothetical protein